ncbi:hypothetical protein ACEXQD_08215 [Herbiconiux sp. P15]|uniref:hypothetical protein n=1 Tax=Herbiconiux liukaitaii TaxID=3342799 RepID=UPI0035B8E738
MTRSTLTRPGRVALAVGAALLAVLIIAIAAAVLLLGRTQEGDTGSTGVTAGSTGVTADSIAPRSLDDALVFPVDEDDDLLPTDDGDEPDATALRLWQLFREVAGDRTADVYTFSIYHDEANDLMAAVTRDGESDDPLRWDAEVNTAYIDDEDELENTILHEVGHILTLSDDQVPELTGTCPTFDLSEGCPKADSLIAAFQEYFWAEYGADVPSDDGPEGSDPAEVAAFFREHGGFETFVSEYAATSAAEDVAESWAEYVLTDDDTLDATLPTDEFPMPFALTPSEAKVVFFEQYPAFVAERDRIRAALGY